MRPSPWLAGLDGCPAGWIAAFVHPEGDEVCVRIAPRFADVLAAPEEPTIVAVDIPIGLPELGDRRAQSSTRCRTNACTGRGPVSE